DARNGASGSYQSYLDVPYTLTAAAGTCSSVTLSPSPASPQVTGTTIGWTASASGTGCSSPQYQFYVHNGSWSVAQAWSSTATFSWTTTGPTAGTGYIVEADARNGASGVYQSYLDVAYSLSASVVINGCTSVTLNPSVASPQAVGATVVWTASASGVNVSDCPSPQYSFYVLGPTGWTLAQNWSTTATFSWNTTALTPGNYP